MSIAEELRRDADDALGDGGMYYSGEYLDGIAKKVEAIIAENAKLRELVKTMWDDVMAFRDTPYMRWDGNAMVDDWTWADERRQAMKELGIEV